MKAKPKAKARPVMTPNMQMSGQASAPNLPKMAPERKLARPKKGKGR